MAANLTDARSHNMPPEVFFKHYREIRDAQRSHEDTGMALARVKKTAKNAGVDLEALKLLQKLSKLDDDEVEAQLRHAREYANYLEMPIGTQLGLFGQPGEVVPDVAFSTREAQKVWEAGEMGLRAGRDGMDAVDNPYTPGSPGYVEWAKKHAVGLSERVTAESMESTEDERPADIAPATKRGRKAPTASQALDKTRKHFGDHNSLN